LTEWVTAVGGRLTPSDMKTFHCDHCEHLLFFESVECVSCRHQLAYLPDLQLIGSLDPDREGLWRSPLPRAADRRYRLCANYTEHQVCNWAVNADDPNPLCLSCRLTRVIPDLTKPEHRVAWYRLETAKRRLVFMLLRLRLPLLDREADPQNGLTFEFKADPPDGVGPPVLTGHASGVITISLAEADDAERERRRTHMHEPYRTLLGHMRHEVGHYYWERLIQHSGSLQPFRHLFGDERRDYAEALQEYYREGPPADWQSRFVSAYASAHAWEDWAETFAHYLHMVDTLETAAWCGMSLSPRRHDEPALDTVPPSIAADHADFEQLIANWFSVTYLINNLNRALGVPDGYPFVLSPEAVEKLRFVHETADGCREERRGTLER
jgi:hypothetical protein